MMMVISDLEPTDFFQRELSNSQANFFFLINNAPAAAKLLELCLTVRPHGWPPTRLLCPRDFPGKNTGVGCHFLL